MNNVYAGDSGCSLSRDVSASHHLLVPECVCMVFSPTV